MKEWILVWGLGLGLRLKGLGCLGILVVVQQKLVSLRSSVRVRVAFVLIFCFGVNKDSS